VIRSPQVVVAVDATERAHPGGADVDEIAAARRDSELPYRSQTLLRFHPRILNVLGTYRPPRAFDVKSDGMDPPALLSVKVAG
jgi:hypothetical protein